MSKKNKKKDYVSFYKENHEYYCIIESPLDGSKVIGVAKCHPEDQDLESEKTGYLIAQVRAEIKSFKHYKKFYLQPQADILKRVYHDISNKKSKEAKIVKRYYYNSLDDIEEMKECIQTLENDLSIYIEQKEQFRKTIRALRQDKND